MKRRIAETIVEAHRSGAPEMAETVPALLKAIQAADQHRIVRLSVARALVALDAREAAPVLWQVAAEEGLEMAQVVEPALARWDYAPGPPSMVGPARGKPDVGPLSWHWRSRGWV